MMKGISKDVQLSYIYTSAVNYFGDHEFRKKRPIKDQFYPKKKDQKETNFTQVDLFQLIPSKLMEGREGGKLYQNDLIYARINVFITIYSVIDTHTNRQTSKGEKISIDTRYTRT